LLPPGPETENAFMLQSKTISIQIRRDYAQVHEFLATPRNLMKWSPGMGPGFDWISGTDWMIERAEGPIVITFSEPNAYGILDHVLTPVGGQSQTVRMRVFPNGAGAEIVYTMFQHEGVGDAQFASDAEWVQSDFAALQSLLENDEDP